jgi:hypothetical protein
MKQKKPYEPPKIIDLQVDYIQAVGATRCAAGPTATGQCNTGTNATAACSNGGQATASCGTGSRFAPANNCQSGNNAVNCKTGSTAG